MIILIVGAGWHFLYDLTGRSQFAALIGVMFAILTHFPPHWPIFMDHMTHSYGITG